jgi:hypothetical protein
MSKFYFISPIGATSPGLFETFPATFVANGHSITNYINEATCVFFDMHSGYLPYDWNVLNVVLEKRLPVCVFDCHDYHGNSTKNWYYFSLQNYIANDWAKFLWLAKEFCKPFIHFLRKMQTDNNFPDWVYPFEYVQFPDHDFPLTTSQELNSRPYDACFIGAKSPRREAFINALQQDGRLKLDIQWTTERIPHEDWLNRHRQAKFFIEADGGGLGSERPYQLMPISIMLKQENLQKINNDWISGFECVKLPSVPTIGDFIHLLPIIRDHNLMYHIYLKGNEKLKTYFSEQYRANYILDILKKNGIC